MGARSAVEQLPGEVREQLETWLVEFAAGRMALDAVMEEFRGWCADRGVDPDSLPSRSSVHRHSAKFEKIAERMKRADAISSALVKQVGPELADGKGMQVLLRSFDSLAYDMIGDVDEAKPLDPENLLFFARSLQAVAGARKTDADLALRLKAEALKEAAARVDEAGRKLGWSADTARQVRAEVLGVSLEKI